MDTRRRKSKRPLKIGISACYFHADPQRPIFKGKTLLYLEQSLIHWVMSKGAMTFLIPSVSDNIPFELSDLVEDLDGLVLQGGSDVSPSSYGELPLKPEWSGDSVRDSYEIELVQEFMRMDKPILGICRGAQLINVAFGGTLFQDIETEIPGALNHRDWEVYDQNFHEITIEPGSQLSKLYGGRTKAKTNAIHHQAVKDLGMDLIVEARSVPDGLVEAIRLRPETNQGRYVFATQWHPEFHDPGDPSLLDSLPILEEFLSEVRKRANGLKG